MAKSTLPLTSMTMNADVDDAASDDATVIAAAFVVVDGCDGDADDADADDDDANDEFQSMFRIISRSIPHCSSACMCACSN